MSKLKGGKKGRPKNPENKQISYEINSPNNEAQNFDALFDLYVHIESGWHDERIREISKLWSMTSNQEDKKLIEKEFDKRLEKIKPQTDLLLKAIQTRLEASDSDFLSTRCLAQELIESLNKCQTLESQHKTVILFKERIKLDPSTEKDILVSLVLRLERLLDDPITPRKLQTEDYVFMFEKIGIDKPSEAEFIMQKLSEIESSTLRNGYLDLKVNGVARVKFDLKFLNSADLMTMSLLAYAILLRGTNKSGYNFTRHPGEKVNLIKSAFASAYDSYRKSRYSLTCSYTGATLNSQLYPVDAAEFKINKNNKKKKDKKAA